jgi:hypothetical protein
MLRAMRRPVVGSAIQSAPPNKALQLPVKGRAPINRGSVWGRTSALRATTAAALAGS